jgi:hypothetical protein
LRVAGVANVEQATPYRQVVAATRLEEAAHQALMRLYSHGPWNKALQQYRRLYEILAMSQNELTRSAKCCLRDFSDNQY